MTISFCLTVTLSSCKPSKTKQVDQLAKNKIIPPDTSKTTIIEFEKNGNYPFDSTFHPANLTKNDVYIIDSLLVACVADYNNSLEEDHNEWIIDIKKHNYRKQFIAVTNKKGEKEVWINCFCHVWENENWKTDILLVQDGGNCYFNFKVNLRTKQFYDLRVSGVA